MKLKNFERELKYLLTGENELIFEDIVEVFNLNNYCKVEYRQKQKNEIYYDDNNLSVIKMGNVIRESTHFNKDGVYSHFMFKKNVSVPTKPYVSKYEYGSDEFKTVQEFVQALEDCNIKIMLKPVLYAEILRETAVFEKDNHKLLMSYDNVTYYKHKNGIQVFEKMLEIEDWTTPYTTIAEKETFDMHLLTINEALLKKLPIQLTKDSKPYRGYLLLK